MAFRYIPQYKERIGYSGGQSKIFSFPRGNLFAGVTVDINTEINIGTGTPSNIPDYQVARMIKEIEIIQDNTTTVWKISGESLAAMFQKRRGMEAPGNSTLSTAVATDKKARTTIYLPFSPDDALKPWDFLMDTRGHKYEMKITFRDVTQAGTFFGTLGTAVITASDAENFVDISVDQVDLKVGPDGQPDSLTSVAPLMRGLFERRLDIAASNSTGLKIDLPSLKTFRNITLWTTHETNAGQVQGNSGVFTDKIILKDTQEKTYQMHTASMLRERTAQRWQDATLNAGLYDLPISKWGAATDYEVSDNIRELYLLASVAKLTNATDIRIISDTAERQ